VVLPQHVGEIEGVDVFRAVFVECRCQRSFESGVGAPDALAVEGSTLSDIGTEHGGVAVAALGVGDFVGRGAGEVGVALELAIVRLGWGCHECRGEHCGGQAADDKGASLAAQSCVDLRHVRFLPSVIGLSSLACTQATPTYRDTQASGEFRRTGVSHLCCSYSDVGGLHLRSSSSEVLPTKY